MDLPCSAKFLKRVSRLPLTVISDASVATQKSVLKELCCYANEKGICWPSIETLSEGESRAPRTVYRALRALEDQDYIERVSYAGRGKSTRRRINVKKIVTDTQKGDTSGMDYGEEKGDTESQKGDSSALKGDSSAQKGDSNGPQKNHKEEPVEEPKEEPLSSPAARASSSDPSSPDGVTTVAEWWADLERVGTQMLENADCPKCRRGRDMGWIVVRLCEGQTQCNDCGCGLDLAVQVAAEEPAPGPGHALHALALTAAPRVFTVLAW